MADVTKEEKALINKFIKRYPEHERDIITFKVEILRTIALVKDIKEEKIETLDDMKALYNGYSKCDKYRELFLHHSVVFHIAFMSKVYSVKALLKYLVKYHGFDRIDTKEKYMDTVKEYLIRFESGILKNSGMDKPTFIQYYSKEMEIMFDEKIKLSKYHEMEKLQFKDRELQRARDQLKRNMQKIDIEKMDAIIKKDPRAIV